MPRQGFSKRKGRDRMNKKVLVASRSNESSAHICLIFLSRIASLPSTLRSVSLSLRKAQIAYFMFLLITVDFTIKNGGKKQNTTAKNDTNRQSLICKCTSTEPSTSRT